jgi:hypothetical protein
VQAWGEYLALEPPDRAAAQGEIARVEKARSVAQSYSQARTALTKRDYDSAVSLLKAIVVEDEAYKDASRLMAQAIELRRARRRFWRGHRLRESVASGVRVISAAAHRAIRARGVRLAFGIGLGLVLVAGTSLAVMGYFQDSRLSPVLAGLTTTRPSEAVPTTLALAPTVTPTPTLILAVASTPTPTVTPTPRPTRTASPQPEWVTEFAEPILEAIADRTPSFQDDFGAGSAGWKEDYCPGSMKYIEGELVVTDCRVFRTNIDWRDFALEVDVRFLEGTISTAEWWLHFRDPGESSGLDHILTLSDNGNVRISLAKRTGGHDSAHFDNVALSNNQTNHILLIAKGNRFAFYLNGQPLHYAENDALRFGMSWFDPTGEVAMDNFKIWDISDIPELP